MSVAERFFTAKEINDQVGIEDASSLWEWLSTERYLDLARTDWGLKTNKTLVFRGQSNSSYGLSSKLYRDVRQELGVDADEVTEELLATVEAGVVQLAREEGLGRLMTDGELLMVLQHHGVATRLIDVSAAPLEALFFAVDGHADRDGRMFLVHPHPTPNAVVDRMDLSAADLPWVGMSRGTKAKASWTQRVAVVPSPALDPRMRAQQGMFLAGGLIKRYRADHMNIHGESLGASEYPQVTTLRINFIRKRRQNRNGSWGATGWTLRVKSTWKRDLLECLAHLSDPITPDTMYPPISELRRMAAREVRRVAGSDLAKGGR